MRTRQQLITLLQSLSYQTNKHYTQQMATSAKTNNSMSPTDVVKMAFSPTKKHQPPSYQPRAPPPASPPPLPPPTDALQQPLPPSFSEDSYSRNVMGDSYQHTARRAEMPRVTHYTTDTERNASSSSSFRGDATLRPNTGEANSADGQALAERLHKLQIVTVVSCITAILLEIPAFVGHLLTLNPSRAVLGGYLVCFSLLLGLYELHHHTTSTLFLQNYFGFLFHPLGRSFYLVLLGGLCVGQGWIPFYIVGGVFWWSALELVYCFVKFPQYRQMDEATSSLDETNLWLAARNRASNYAWATPETMSLLRNAVSGGSTVS